MKKLDLGQYWQKIQILIIHILIGFVSAIAVRLNQFLVIAYEQENLNHVDYVLEIYVLVRNLMN